MIRTDAWVLHRGPEGAPPGSVPGELSLEELTFPALTPHEALVEPLYGCWEANLTHALERSPVDICRQRGEERVVLGNAGIVRVVAVGRAVTAVAEGDVCFFGCFGRTDRFGYLELVHAYDAPGTVGVLAKQVKMAEHLLHRVPDDPRYGLTEWAPYARYWTAWDNWQVAHACWRSQMDRGDATDPLVFGWGGGVTLAELELARRDGFRVAMSASGPERIAQLTRLGIAAVDRRAFPDLYFDQRRYRADDEYRDRYLASEREFLRVIHELSDGYGVSIFIDNIGGPTYRATLKALGRQAVLTTVGWKRGMRLETLRATECITRHIHVHTHACRPEDVPRIVEYQRSTGWLPDMSGERVYGWESVPQLAKDYAAGAVAGYFPLFRVNEV